MDTNERKAYDRLVEGKPIVDKDGKICYMQDDTFFGFSQIESKDGKPELPDVWAVTLDSSHEEMGFAEIGKLATERLLSRLFSCPEDLILPEIWVLLAFGTHTNMTGLPLLDFYDRFFALSHINPELRQFEARLSDGNFDEDHHS